uniref:Partition protein n=1 Tax=Actinobacillus pleuropneumoniae TaxID=715 RepID=A6XBS9_ACTPL|nr:ParA family protein [Actinobacillus pleuropneumoniae]ABF72150.1 partition protein [Actinobacillus pleuropneumoniae]
MEIITIASAKGGVSKSLLAVNLYDYLKNEGKKVLLLDTELQRSAFEFLSDIGEEDITATADISEVKDILKQAEKEKYDYVVVDTAPTITNLNASLISLSDKVLIAVKPARFDVKSVYNTVDLVKNSNAKCCILLTQTINTSSIIKNNIEELREIFKEEGIIVLNNTLSHSAAYVNSINDGKTIFRTKQTKQKLELTKIFSSLLAI